jgi:hypothetical protein
MRRICECYPLSTGDLMFTKKERFRFIGVYSIKLLYFLDMSILSKFPIELNHIWEKVQIQISNELEKAKVYLLE